MKLLSFGLLSIVLGTFGAATNSERVKRNAYGGSGSSSSSGYTSSPSYRTGNYGANSYGGSSYGSPGNSGGSFYGAGSNSIGSYPSQVAQGTYQANTYPYMYMVPMYQQSWDEDESDEESGIDLLAIKSALAKAVLGAIGKVKGSILAAKGKVIQTKGNIVAAKGGALLKLGQALKSLGGSSSRGSSSYSQDYSSSSYNGYK